jgi:predicted membrane protein
MEGVVAMSFRHWIGIILILLGIGFVLNETGVIYFGDIFATYWPVVLMLIGLGQILKKNPAYVWGALWILAGVLFQLRELSLLPVNIHTLLWPAVIIIVGVSLLIPRSNREARARAVSDGTDTINYTAVFSAVEAACDSASFKGGTVSAVFGGADIDLRDAVLSPEGGYLDLTAVFGGIDVVVPRDWAVRVTGVPIFGGWDAKVERKADKNAEGAVLHIHCVAMFGGVDIKN